MATNEFTFAQACVALGVSAHTLRRRITSGEVQAERVRRPQGYTWIVYLDQAPGSRDGTDVTSRVPGDRPAITLDGQPSPAGTQAADGHQLALALAPLVEASVSAAVAPLRAELADVRATLSQRDQELGQLRAVLGQVLADRDAGPASTRQDASKAVPWWAFWRWATT